MIIEHKTGEIFDFLDEWYQCVEHEGCEGCAFYHPISRSCSYKDSIKFGPCSSRGREDKKSVIFKKLENVGEPYERYIGSNKSIKVQRYRLPYRYAILPKEPFMILEPNYKNSIEIGIKQIKEDLEEKNESAEEISIRIANEFEEKLEKHFKEYMDKIDTRKLKPFDIQKAKEGKPVCTRDGRKARIICFDAKRKDEKSIIALIPSKDYPEFEDLIAYPNDGNYYGGHENDGDLMLLPEKKEGWVNVYRDCDGANITKDDNIYSSKEAAMASAQIIDGNSYVATTKINWEE